MAIEKGDFIEIDFIGRQEDEVFDTTKEEVAKRNDKYSPQAKYGPLVICVGQENVVPGLDEALKGKEEDETFTVELEPEDAFGNKDTDKIELVSKKQFNEEEITPRPGLRVNIDGEMATIRRVSGGRVLVDFNHPLAGKEVEYEVDIIEKLENTKEQIKGFISTNLMVEPEEVEINDSEATVKMSTELPGEAQENIAEEVEDIIDDIEKVEVKTIEENEEEAKDTRSEEENTNEETTEEQDNTTQE